MHHRNSIAGPEKGLEVPDEKEVFNVDTADRPDRAAEDGSHTVIQWHGGEYSRQNTWIEARNQDVINLDDAR